MSGSDIIRAFVAVNIPSEIRDHIARETASIFRRKEELKIVKPENFHLTLAFIGDIDPENLKAIENPMRLFCDGFKRFSVQFGKIGTFPGVIFLRTVQGEEKLIDLATAVRTILRNNSIPYDNKPFKGHLTLARTRNRSMKAVNCLVDDFQAKVFEIGYQVQEFTIYKSDLTPSGPIYTALYKFNLAKLSDQET